ncbi:MAG: arginine deiminase family protein [Blastocatellia bacterium]
MLTAITRAVSSSINDCELTFHLRQQIDIARAAGQHRAYEACLRELGVHVISLAAEPNLPDAVFVEDAAIVVDEVAIMTRMGAASRRGETESLARVLSLYRPVKYMEAPATLDGGDVMRIGRTLFVGASSRTNAEGVTGLRELLAPHGYQVKSVCVTGCLHLKSACTYVGRNSILINREWVDAAQLEGFELVDVSATEPNAANVLLIDDVVIMPDSFPQTRAMLEARGFLVRAVDVSELQKAEGGVTCKSLIFNA